MTLLSILPRAESSLGVEEHYGLAHRPFTQTLDQRFVCPSGSYARAVEEVQRALHRREGLVVVTGEVGTGKTLMCRSLLRQLEGPVCVSIILDPRMSVDELLLHVLTDFGVVVSSQPLVRSGAGASVRRELVLALQRFLGSLIPLGAHAVLIVDEAQHLDLEALEQLRLLTNFETDEEKLLQIVLVGQPELDRRLRSPEMRSLDQRISRRCELQRLSPREVQQYIERRLVVAQQLTLRVGIGQCQPQDPGVDAESSRVLFTRSAIRAVATHSRGVPRLINLLCDRALEIGSDRQTHTIDARVVREAAGRVNLPRPRVPSMPVAIKTAAAAAAVVLLAAGPATRSWANFRSAQAAPTPPASFARTDAPVAIETAERGMLPVADSYNVTVGSFKSAERASTLALKLEASGLPAFTQYIQDRDWHKVIVGPYASESEAMTVQSRLVGDGHSETRVFVQAAERSTGDGDPDGVLILRSADRVSLVLALSEEPQKVETRTSADAVLDVEAGPLSQRVSARELTPGTNVPLITGVSLGDSGAGATSVFARVRIKLLGQTLNHVRVAGSRLYIDMWSPNSGVTPTATPLRYLAESQEPLPHEPPSQQPERAIGDYRQAIGPAVTRLKAIEPFMLSAVASPEPAVMSALARTVNELDEWMRRIEPPQQWVDTHRALVSAVGAASEAVSPGFTGDRGARARQAFAFRDLAASGLN